MKTLLLDPTSWDLTVDAYNNIAVAGDPYSLAQDSASQIKLFLGELYYDTVLGIPYWTEILGKFPSPRLMKTAFNAAAKLTPEVVDARCFLVIGSLDRVVRGQVQILDANNNVLSFAGF